MKKFVVLNPVGETVATKVFTAPRIEDLNHKRIGLFWNGKHNGDIVLLRIGEFLKKKFMVRELVRFNHGYEGIGPAAIKEIVEKSDLVISSLGD
jgi:hypothetical protein